MFRAALLVLAIGLVLDDVNAEGQVCFDAKTCIHNAIERCGVDSQGNVRRFLDTCDIKEYNCIKKTDYVKTSAEKCNDLPLLEAKGNGNGEEQLPDVHAYWCWRARNCHPTRRNKWVCAKDIQMKTRVFKKFLNQCTVFKRNCKSGSGFLSVWFILQNNNSLAAKEDINTAVLMAQYYCHRFRTCRPPGRGPVCGYSDEKEYLKDFKDDCDMFKTNCDGKGRVVFYVIEKEICDMKRKYDAVHKGEVFEFEHISRFSPSPSPSLEGYRVQDKVNEVPSKPKSHPHGYPQRVKLATEN